jgi:hypothetical protein
MDVIAFEIWYNTTRIGNNAHRFVHEHRRILIDLLNAKSQFVILSLTTASQKDNE